jgi:hypothetical protein
MKQLSNTPELLSSLTILCIDNKKIRDRIVNDEKIKVKGLPCFIRLNDETGNYDIFEGSNAFDFFTNLQQQIFQNEKEAMLKLELERENELKEREREREREREKERELRENELKKEIERKKSQQFKSSNTNIIQEAKRQEQLRQQDQSKDTSIKKKEPEKKVSFTPIEDLEDLEDISISSYTHVPKTENSDFSERDQMDKAFAKQSSGSLLSKAMQMQKERA